MYTQAELNRAVASALASERAKIADVFNAPACKGREHLAAGFLAAADGSGSAASIKSLLASLPTDAERESEKKRREQARIGESWDRAYASLGCASKKQDKTETADLHGWEKAYANLAKAQGIR